MTINPRTVAQQIAKDYAAIEASEEILALPDRPDDIDVIHHDNEAIEEIAAQIAHEELMKGSPCDERR